MGLAGASNSAVTGLQAQSTNIAIVSDNIANASTTGYKSVIGNFSTLITSTGQSTNGYSSGGVSVSPQTLVDQQGLIETTGNATDLAISGAGFFAVQDDAGNLLLTRAGSFSVNNVGELTNAAGFKLLGWPLDSNGQLPGATGNPDTTAAESTDSLQVVNTNAASGAASPTTTISVGMNLNAGETTYQGAGVTLAPVSTANNAISENDIIAPATGMQQGDQLAFSSNGTTSTFTYGGFAESKDLSVSPLYGANSATQTFSTTGGDLVEGDKFTIDTQASGTVTFTYTGSSPDTTSGQFNSLETLSEAINNTTGLTSRVNGTTMLVSSKDADQAVTFGDVNNDGMTADLGLSNVAAVDPTAIPPIQRFNSMLGLSNLITTNANDQQLGASVLNPTSGAQIHVYSKNPLQTLTLTKITNSVTVDLQSAENGLNTPTDIIVPLPGTSSMVPENTSGTNANAATVSVTDAAGTGGGTFTYGGIGATKDINTTAILGATSTSQAFTPGSGLVDGGTLTFTETDASTGTSHTVTTTFKTSPSVTGQFNSLNGLAAAINTNANFHAKVDDGKLYITSANNANNLIDVTGSAMTGDQIASVFGGDFTSAGTGSLTANIVQPAGTGNSVDITSTAILGASTPATVFTPTVAIPDGSTMTLQENGGSPITLTMTVAGPTSGTVFNSLATLATAINSHAGYHASVVNGRLYVEASNIKNTVTMSAAGGGTTVGDWAGALGGSFQAGGSIATGTTHTQRFATLGQLDSLIAASTNFSATALTSNSTNAGINIKTTDGTQVTVGGANNGNLLTELGISAGAVGNGLFSEMSLSTIVPPGTTSKTVAITYDPNDPTKNMAGGNVKADFSRNMTIYDALGTAHNFTMGFLKTGDNKWAVELYSDTPTDISNDVNGDGMLVSGNLTFNGDGSLASVSSSLTNPLTVKWTSGAVPGNVTLDLGTAGQPSGTPGAAVIGETDGIRQFDSVYNVDFVQQNGVAAGQFGGIEVGNDGTISAKFSNGQIKPIYKLPIMVVADPDALTQKSGNVFAVSQASGDVNLKQAGLGGAGTMVSGALEGSTADIATELTQTIAIQSNYNANATVISTIKAMEDELNTRL